MILLSNMHKKYAYMAHLKEFLKLFKYPTFSSITRSLDS